MKLMCKESSRVSSPAKVRTQLPLCTAPQGKNTTYLLINTPLLEMTALQHKAQAVTQKKADTYPLLHLQHAGPVRSFLLFLLWKLKIESD